MLHSQLYFLVSHESFTHGLGPFAFFSIAEEFFNVLRVNYGKIIFMVDSLLILHPHGPVKLNIFLTIFGF